MAKDLTVAADPARSRLVLSLTWDDGEPTIQRRDPDGWHYVRYAAPALLTSGEAEISDYEAPLDVEVYYYVSAPAVVDTFTSPETYTLESLGDVWLKHLADPSLSQRVYPMSVPAVTRPAYAGTFAVLGRGEAIAVTTPRGQEAGTLDLSTETDGQRIALEALLADGTVMQLAFPGGNGFGSRFILCGDQSENRVTHYGPEKTRLWSIPFTVVAPPTI